MKNTLTRADIAQKLMKSEGLTRQQSTEFVASLFEVLSTSLAQGEKVKISSFGTFSLREKGLRMGRNPRTGEEAPIAPRQVVTFKASPIFKDSIKFKG